MSELLAIRDGLPGLASRARAGLPSTIVAYGTSLTVGGQYLAQLTAALDEATSGAPIRLINRGLPGFGSFMAAFRVGGDVLPLVPDLVLFEFAHNDRTDDALVEIGRSLDAMIARIREVNPACEFAFIYLAAAGSAADGPTAAMHAYEVAADYYGAPSFDLAALSASNSLQRRR